MKISMSLLFVLCLVTVGGPAVSAQTYAPLVTMSVTGPDGKAQQVSARESGVATFTVNDTTYELRPTIHDEPFTRVTVAIFKAATATESTALLGEVQVTKGAAAVASKTTPAFRIAVTNIEMAAPKKTS